MSEGFEGVCFLIEIGAVAGEQRSFVEERHIAVENLCPGMFAILVEAQHVGMFQIHTLVGLGALAAFGCLSRLCHAKSKQA